VRTSTSEPVWGTVPLTRPLRGTHRADLVVVGLGGSGLAALQRARELGLHALGVDAGRVAGGAAGRNGGFLLAGPAKFHHIARQHWPFAASFYEATCRERDRIVKTTPGARPTGSLRRAFDVAEIADLEAHARALTEDGFPAELTPDGLLIPGDGVFQPVVRCMSLLEPTHVFTHSPVRLDSEGVVGDQGEIRAPRVLLAVDGQLHHFLPRDVVRPVRLQMLATEPTERLQRDRAVYSRFGMDYWHQLPDGRIALGGARDFGGDAEETDVLATTDLVQSMLESVLRHQIGSKAAITHRWAGIVGMSHDDLPVVRSARRGTLAIGGYSGTGNVVGSLLARLAVEQMTGRQTPLLDHLLR